MQLYTTQNPAAHPASQVAPLHLEIGPAWQHCSVSLIEAHFAPYVTAFFRAFRHSCQAMLSSNVHSWKLSFSFSRRSSFNGRPMGLMANTEFSSPSMGLDEQQSSPLQSASVLHSVGVRDFVHRRSLSLAATAVWNFADVLSNIRDLSESAFLCKCSVLLARSCRGIYLQ